jgi:hypothetical protein
MKVICGAPAEVCGAYVAAHFTAALPNLRMDEPHQDTRDKQRWFRTVRRNSRALLVSCAFLVYLQTACFRIGYDLIDVDSESVDSPTDAGGTSSQSGSQGVLGGASSITAGSGGTLGGSSNGGNASVSGSANGGSASGGDSNGGTSSGGADGGTSTSGAGTGGSAGATAALPTGCTAATLNTRHYVLCKTRALWSDAQSSCSSMGMTLARIDSAEENTWIVNTLIGPSGSNLPEDWVFVGGTDAAVEGSWIWPDGAVFTTGKQPTSGMYTNWRSGEPNNAGAGEDCLLVQSGGSWIAMTCEVPRNYACEQN